MLIPQSIQRQLEQLDTLVKLSEGPFELQELLNKTVLFGGKRLRPMLLFYAGEFFALELERLLPFAMAIEQIHAASLSHDDVIDNGTIRRGRPSINQVGGNKRAVLAGDYLLAEVLSTIVDQDCPHIMKETARVTKALASGEWQQLDLICQGPPTFEQLEQIAINKTGSVLGWCLVVPAILAGRSAIQIDAIREVGHRIGLAFQMVDDALDFNGSSLKDYNADFANGQVNFVLCDYFMRKSQAWRSFEQSGTLDLDDNELVISTANIRQRAVREIESAKELFQSKFAGASALPLFELFDLLIMRSY